MRKNLPKGNYLFYERFPIRFVLILLFTLLLFLSTGCRPGSVNCEGERINEEKAESVKEDKLLQKKDPSLMKPSAVMENHAFMETATILPVSLPVHAVARMDANCRWGPGTEYEVVSGLYLDQAAEVIGSNTDHSWWYVDIPGNGQCWVAAFTVNLNRDIDELPLVTAPPSISVPTATGVPATPEPVIVYHEYESQLFELINLQRKAAGVAELVLQPQLTKAARLHSRDMAQKGYFSHTDLEGRSPFERILKQGYRFSVAAENIAAGHGKPQDAVQAWMNSDGHRKNMLNPQYTQVGLAYVFDTDSEYITYWTSVFASP